MSLNLTKTRTYLQSFDFTRLFVEELGWEPPSKRRSDTASIKGITYTVTPVSTLSGIGVFEITTPSGIPDASARALIHKQVSELCYENLLIFLDENRSQSLWYWVRRESGKSIVRDHLYVKGQPGDLFLGKLAAMVVDISELDESGNIPITEVARRLKSALDVERVTKRFFKEFEAAHIQFRELIGGIDNELDRRWYASVLLHRLMFIWFLQKKFFLDNGDAYYLQNKLDASPSGKDRYYTVFLRTLFFEGFAKPEGEARGDKVNALLGKIPYLNGGLFLPHRIERDWPDISVPDKALANLYSLFRDYSWNLNDEAEGKDDEINPDVLGYIFEKYINQKEFGAYYTRTEITEYLCERTIHQLILDAVNLGRSEDKSAHKSRRSHTSFATIGDLLLGLDAPLCVRLLDDVLPKLSLLDPACGSGAFLVAAMKTLIDVYAAIFGRIEILGNRDLLARMHKIRKDHASVAYYIKKRIITDNLFGVDIMEEAVEIAKLRLFLALVSSASRAEELEPLPNIEFNIMPGNSLIGLLDVDAATAAQETDDIVLRSFFMDYKRELDKKNELIELYRRAADKKYCTDIKELRDGIEERKAGAKAALNQVLLHRFGACGIKYEQVIWDVVKGKEDKSKKRALREQDISALKPFHWGYEFDRVLNERGGFDAIITNPPWEILKPNSKEFFEKYSDVVSKKKMTIQEFEKKQKQLLGNDRDLLEAWQTYLSSYPHVSAWFRSAPQFANQISIIDGKKAGSDINLYKLFIEQCFRLIRQGGYCGIVVPSGIYTDLGTKQLREMLFGQASMDAICSFSNEGGIFDKDAVHHAFKFCLLTYQKGGKTNDFAASFRIHPSEAISPDKLEMFLHSSAERLDTSVELIRRLSPDSLSVMEFKSPLDVIVAEKMLRFPLLGDKVEGQWNVRFTAELHMTNDSHLFKNAPGNGRLPLYEGKMIWQFGHRFAEPRFWVNEKEARSTILGRNEDEGQELDYQTYRLGLRAVSGSVNERTLVATVLPPHVVCGNSLLVAKDGSISSTVSLGLTAFLNSFVIDGFLRQKVSQNINMFYLYQLPVPRLTAKCPAFRPIAERAARLVCTTPEFDELAKEIFGGRASSQTVGVTVPSERAQLRAELDALVAHLYGLTETEFAHILSTFPLVPDPVKIAAHNAFRNVEKGLIL